MNNINKISIKLLICIAVPYTLFKYSADNVTTYIVGCIVGLSLPVIDTIFKK